MEIELTKEFEEKLRVKMEKESSFKSLKEYIYNILKDEVELTDEEYDTEEDLETEEKLKKLGYL